MKGYKAFNSDLTCRGFQYAIGEEYSMEGKPQPCNRGFHFCETIADCYNYYPTNDGTRICEVEAIGEVVKNGDKYCTNKIRIVAEVAEEYLRKANNNKTSSGFCNSGDCNSGNWNSGNWNSGDRNSGNWSSGDCNSGNCNSGNWNSGDRNSGNCNSGDWNSGNWNSGNRNSGNRNSGNWNSGDWNSGNWNSGIFCTSKEEKIKIFDQESTWTIRDWYDSEARRVMQGCPYTHSDFILDSRMTDEEKAKHPEYKTIGGYIKTYCVSNEDKQTWWESLTDTDRAEVMSLPNFDEKKFEECTGIKVEG